MNIKNMVQKWIKDQKQTNFIIFLLAGVLLLIIALPTGDRKKTEETEYNESDNSDFVREQEEKLADILGNIEGVGKVKVMITVKDDGYSILDKNLKTDGQEREEDTVLVEKDREESPYVTSRVMPEIEGVVVVAQGGGNARVNNEISDAVMALFDVEVHKIKIVKMSVREG